jgi:hypothetical protein
MFPSYRRRPDRQNRDVMNPAALSFTKVGYTD